MLASQSYSQALLLRYRHWEGLVVLGAGMLGRLPSAICGRQGDITDRVYQDRKLRSGSVQNPTKLLEVLQRSLVSQALGVADALRGELSIESELEVGAIGRGCSDLLVD